MAVPTQRFKHPVHSTEQPRRSFGLSKREYERLLVIQKLVRRDLTLKQAAEMLDLGTRQVRTLQHRFVEAGAAGLMSKHRGKRSNRAYPIALQRQAIDLVRKRYAHLGPTRVREHLANRHGIAVSVETVSTWMTAAKLWRPRSKRSTVSAMKPNGNVRASDPLAPCIPLFDDWMLDTQELVATADAPKGQKRLKLVWYDGTICWCEASGRFGARQLQKVLDAARKHLCPDRIGERHRYVPEAMGTGRNTPVA
jgi:transposase